LTKANGGESPLEVVAVTQAEPLSKALQGRHLDQPAVGATISPRACKVIGWVLPESGRVVAVELLDDEHLIRRARLGVRRPDLVSAFPDKPAAEFAGFDATINLRAVRAAVRLEARAVLDTGGRVPIGATELRRLTRAAGNGVKRSLVSVVIPCFNQAHFLDEAIESVLVQTHSDLEIIAVDDGSTDNTAEVAARYPGVKRIRQPNRGVGAGRNAGFTQASGAYVVFLDADDRLLPPALEIGLEAFARQPNAGFIAGTCRHVGPDGVQLSSAKEGGGTVQEIDDGYMGLLHGCFILSGSAVMYPRWALESVGAFDETRSAGDDYDLYLRIARKFPAYFHDEVVTDYRRHGCNMTRDPGLLLASEISVLRGQRRFVRDRRDRVALREGLRKTKRKHGRAVLGQLQAELRRREWRQAIRSTWVLMRWHPLAFIPTAR
jgi:glycosyltransferase involved in cell wall biosynthesis